MLRVRRAGPVCTLTLVLGAVTLFFVGCLSFSEHGFWKKEEAEKPIEPVAVDRLIRVRLMGRRPRPSEELSVTAPYALTDTQSGAQFGEKQPPVSLATVRPAGEAGIEIGEKLIPSGDITLTPSRDAAIVLGDRTYRGTLRIQREADGLVFTNHLDIEAYLKGVLRGELPRYFHIESFKAQCVAARTYALYSKRNKPAGKTFDVYDDEGSQVYKGVAMEDATAVEAVDATHGEVCVYDDGEKEDIFCTYYSSCCGGLSQHVNNVKPNDPPAPPLAGGVACEDCYVAPRYRWEPVKISKAEVTKKLVARYPSIRKIGTVTGLRPRKRTEDGRIISMEIVGSGGQKEVLIGEDFRLSMGGRLLKSTNFAIETTKDAFIFKDGKGFGHGMGLCQYGMETKARRGMDYRRILATYYPGSTVKRIYE